MHAAVRTLRRSAAAVAVCATLSARVLAQPIARPAAAERGPIAADARQPDGADPATDALRGRKPAPWWAPLASLAVPGAGQVAMREPRAAAYLGLELYEWIQLVESTRDGHRLRAEYRRIAREIARQPFGGTFPDGTWAYYEAMSEPWYTASGRFNLGTDATVVPETDESTFNGALWLKARGIYWVDVNVAPARTDPSYQRALDFYTGQAVRDEFQWTWRNAQISQADYANTIKRYNTATRDVRNTLGVILANHLVSSIDALATVRIRQSRGPVGERRYDVSIPLDAFGRRGRTSK